MILLLNGSKKECYKTTIENSQELIEIRNRLTEFNDKNYTKIGNSSIEERDPRFIDTPYYNKYYDLYYIPISYSNDNFLLTNNYNVLREVYRSNYRIVLRLISSILENDPKIVDLTDIIGNFTSVEELLERRERFRKQIINTKFPNKEKEEEIKKKYNIYSYVVKCLTCVQLEKTNYKVKEKSNFNGHNQAA